MTENDELTPEEEANASPADEGTMKIEVDGKEILTEVAMETPAVPAHPTANLSDTPDEPVATEEEIAEVKEPSKFQLFVRKALIWFGIVVAFFAAGFATFYFLLYQPKVAELEDLQEKISAMDAKLEELEAEAQGLRLEAITNESELQHKALLAVMVDTYDARYALGEENIVAAKSALSSTDTTLGMILADIRSFDSGLADTLPQRLELIRTNIDRDVETAIEDCNQLIEDLLAVEAALYP